MGLIITPEAPKLYTFDKIHLANTNEFRRAALHFDKYGCYTKASPKYDKKEFKEYWDEETRRCTEGYSVGGVRITGDHYDYLNYSRIRLTRDPRATGILGGQKEPVVKNLKVSATKSFHFPDFWDGDYHYFHAVERSRIWGKHLCVGKSRRKGYSYKNAKLAVSRYTFIPRSITVIAAFDSSSLYPEGTVTKAIEYIDWLDKHTDWKKRRLVDSNSHIKSGYEGVGENSGVEYGFKSQIIGVTCKDNPGAIRGKDGTLILFEEGGKFPNLKATYAATKPTVEDGMFVTGMMIIFGTGGGEDTWWGDFEEIFYNAEAYGMLAFENIWDEGAMGNTCGFFAPVYDNMPGFMDKDGNSLVEEAKQFEQATRQHIKDNATDNKTLDDHTAENPMNPAEAFQVSGDNIFPVVKIASQEQKVKHNPDIKYLAREGVLIGNHHGKIVFKTNVELKAEGLKTHSPINDWPIKKNTDLTGCIVEWEPPYHDMSGMRIGNLYQIWHDPFGMDKDGKNLTMKDSLGTAYVYERTNNFTPSKGNKLVAAYVGRTETMDEYNHQLFLLAQRYKAEILFENDRGTVYQYAKTHKLLEYLADEPDMLWVKELSGKHGRNKGMHMDDKRKAKGAVYLRDLLLSKVGSNTLTGEAVTFLDYIYDLGLLTELRKWFSSGNFDRVSALLIGMFHIKEKEAYEVQQAKEEDSNDFFSRKLYR